MTQLSYVLNQSVNFNELNYEELIMNEPEKTILVTGSNIQSIA